VFDARSRITAFEEQVSNVPDTEEIIDELSRFISNGLRDG
jgi:hypothetical protein